MRVDGTPSVSPKTPKAPKKSEADAQKSEQRPARQPATPKSTPKAPDTAVTKAKQAEKSDPTISAAAKPSADPAKAARDSGTLLLTHGQYGYVPGVTTRAPKDKNTEEKGKTTQNVKTTTAERTTGARQGESPTHTSGKTSEIQGQEKPSTHQLDMEGFSRTGKFPDRLNIEMSEKAEAIAMGSLSGGGSAKVAGSGVKAFVKNVFSKESFEIASKELKQDFGRVFRVVSGEAEITKKVAAVKNVNVYEKTGGKLVTSHLMQEAIQKAGTTEAKMGSYLGALDKAGRSGERGLQRIVYEDKIPPMFQKGKKALE